MRLLTSAFVCPLVVACAPDPKTGERQFDLIYMFAGTDGAMAYSVEKSGSNLPKEHEPWRFRREVPTDGPTFKAGTDKWALGEVKKHGFVVTVWTVTIEDQPPIEE